MASPAFVSESHVLDSAANTSVVVTAPVTISTNNGLIAFVYISSSSAVTVTPPSGWTLQYSDATATPAGSLFVFTKLATSSEPTSYTFGKSASSFSGIAILNYSGVPSANGNNFINGGLFNTYSSGTSSFDAPSIVPSVVNDTLLACYCDFLGKAITTAPTGMTQRINVQQAGDETMGVYDLGLTTTAATGNKTAIWASGSATTGIAAAVLLKSTTTITLSRTFKWNVRASLSLSRIVIWNTRASLSLSRIFKWNVLVAVAIFTRIFKWNVRAVVTPFTRIFKWNVIGGVLIGRIFIWNTRQTITPTRIFKWNVTISVTPFTRNFIWNTRVQVSLARSFVWNVIFKLITSRIFVWNVRSILSTSRTFLWNDVGRIIIIRSLVWDVYAPWVANVKDCGSWTSINGNTVAWTPEQVNSTSWR